MNKIKLNISINNINHISYSIQHTISNKTICDNTKIISHLPAGFKETLKIHRLRKNITQEKLEQNSLVSVATIRRMENEIKYNSSLEKIISICIGLSLYPEFSFDLINKSNYSLNYTIPEHNAYRIILTYFYHLSIYECNEILISLEMKPLS